VCYITDAKLGDELPTCCFLVDINIRCKIPGLYEYVGTTVNPRREGWQITD